jgi:hypothetical protein
MVETTMNITHLVSVYGRSLHKSITPVLDSRLNIRKLTLLTPPRCKPDAIIEILAQRDIEVSFITVNDLDSPGMLKRAFELTLAEPAPEEGLTALNLSGANPIAASLGTQIFRSRKLPVFSITATSDKIVWLAVPEGVTPTTGMDVESHLCLEDVLKIHGIVVLNCWQKLASRETKWDGLCQSLLEEAHKDSHTFARFTALCRAVTTISLVTEAISAQSKSLRRIAQLVIDAGFASHVSVEGSDSFRLRLKTPLTVTFLSGGWLEHLVMMAAGKLQQEGLVQDAACGIKLDIGGNVSNELDGIFLANDRIYAIECKAKKPKGKSGAFGIGPDTIYKIDSICAIREFEATPILVTLAKPCEAEVLRMGQENIHSVSGRQLDTLPDQLRRILAC